MGYNFGILYSCRASYPMVRYIEPLRSFLKKDKSILEITMLQSRKNSITLITRPKNIWILHSAHIGLISQQHLQLQ